MVEIKADLLAKTIAMVEIIARLSGCSNESYNLHVLLTHFGILCSRWSTYSQFGLRYYKSGLGYFNIDQSLLNVTQKPLNDY